MGSSFNMGTFLDHLRMYPCGEASVLLTSTTGGKITWFSLNLFLHILVPKGLGMNHLSNTGCLLLLPPLEDQLSFNGSSISIVHHSDHVIPPLYMLCPPTTLQCLPSNLSPLLALLLSFINFVLSSYISRFTPKTVVPFHILKT